jgi:hypothetical protein
MMGFFFCFFVVDIFSALTRSLGGDDPLSIAGTAITGKRLEG